MALRAALTLSLGMMTASTAVIRPVRLAAAVTLMPATLVGLREGGRGNCQRCGPGREEDVTHGNLLSNTAERLGCAPVPFSVPARKLLVVLR
jgi:hypothetical protein